MTVTNVPEVRCTYVGGEWHVGESTSRVTSRSPSSGEVLIDAPASSEKQVDEAIECAHKAFAGTAWAAYGPTGRAEVLKKLADLIEADAETFASLIVDEIGTPVSAVMRSQVLGPVAVLRWYASQARTGPRGAYEVPLPPHGPAGARFDGVVTYEPVGVVAALPAFNFPLTLAVWKLGGALASGCTAVVLPAVQGMGSTIRLFELLDELDLPEGVVNLVGGGPAEGQLLTSDPRVSLVSFTGSEAVGSQIMKQSSTALARPVLELGGKAANIILPGVDVASVVPASIVRFVSNAGQVCGAWTRILVHESMAAEFEAQAALAMSALVQGDPHDEATVVGPVINGAQRDRVESLVAAALSRGARVVGSAEPPTGSPGFYVAPRILADVPDGDPVLESELFAPVAVMITYSDVEEAIEIANSHQYGLSTNVYGPTEEAMAVARRIQAGTVIVNGGPGIRPDAPWGGMRRSGFGRELGEEGFAEFFNPRHIQWPAGA